MRKLNLNTFNYLIIHLYFFIIFFLYFSLKILCFIHISIVFGFIAIPFLVTSVLLLPAQVEEEKKLLLDPTFINRDAILISYFVQLMDIQKTLITDLDFISSRMTMVYHSELPVMQLVIFTQERVIYMLQEIVTRNAAVSCQVLIFSHITILISI